MNQVITFYTEILGLKVVKSEPSFVTLQTKNLQLYLHHAKNPPRTQERKKIKIPQISFKVDDIDTAFTYLRQAKVNITRGIVEYDPTTFVFNFLDPDGNSMAFESDRRKKA